MNKQRVTCPCGCNHTFEIDIYNFEYYENLVAQWTNGKLANHNNPGYDVITSIDGQDITIQVKHSKVIRDHRHDRKTSEGRPFWNFNHQLGKNNPDLFVLFGVDDYGYSVFIMSFDLFISKGFKYSQGFKNEIIKVVSRCGPQSYIWHYIVKEPKENLNQRIREMMIDKQSVSRIQDRQLELTI